MTGAGLRDFPERLGPAGRTVAWLLLPLTALFVAGAITGFIVGAVEHGHLPTRPVAYLIFAAMLALFAGSVIGIISLLRHQASAGSPFERRYSRMWMIIIGLSIPAGLILGIFGSPFDLPGVPPIDGPGQYRLAIVLALVIILTLSAAAIVYHRSIDQHEELAALWAGNIAFYFLAVAIPIWLVLAWGGVVPPLDGTIALGIVIASTFVQAGVWAWKKFR